MAVPTALVVDDDVREITQVALELVGGWTVLPADGGGTAVGLAREHVPDAVLPDVTMPGMDGVETFQQLRADDRTRQIPVILPTAKVQSGDRQAWDGLDIVGVIAKPFDPMGLAGEVGRMLGWPA